MQVLSTEVIRLIGIASIIFLIAPLFVMSYVLLYNRKKKKHLQEKEQLQKSFEQELLLAQIEVQEQTLKNIAYDLHDNVGQLLSLTTITLSAIDLADQAAAAEKIGIAEDLTRRSIAEIKTLSKLFHGEDLVNKGLLEAIQFELEMLKRSGKFEVRLSSSKLHPTDIENSVKTILFRIFQECINNIIQHAHASQIVVILKSDGNSLSLSIADNGVGFILNNLMGDQKGMGLNTIKKRAAMLNGNAAITSRLGEGTQILITIP